MNTSNFFKLFFASTVLLLAADSSFAQSDNRQAAPNSDRGAVKAMPIEQVKIKQAQSTEQTTPNNGQTPNAVTNTKTGVTAQPVTNSATSGSRPAPANKTAATAAPKSATTGRPAVKPAAGDRK